MDFICDQKTTESCVLNAKQQLHWIGQGVQGAKTRVRMSRLFGYYNSRCKHGSQNVDMGTMPRSSWKAIAGLGVCPETDWPFDTSEVNTKPTWKAYKNAIDQKWLKGYYQIYEFGAARCERVKQALSQNHPVIFGMGVGPEFESYKSGVLPIPSEILGLHMVCAVGYDQEGLIIANSWGEDWGIPAPDFESKFKGGFAKLSWDLVGWYGASDWWVAEQVVEFTS
jgi:C1A family cysteine protease